MVTSPHRSDAAERERQDCCAGESAGADQRLLLEPYPYDRLESLRAVAAEHPGGCVDLSVGDPTDPPPPAAVEALADSGAERSYPSSVGSLAVRRSAACWLERRFGIAVAPDRLAACVGTKEFVTSLPHLLRLRRPERDTVLYPAVAYPSYAMGATLAGLRAVPVPLDGKWRLDLASVAAADAARALCLWVNSPGNPTGALEDLGTVATWGRERGVVVCSDECYAEYVWDQPRRAATAPPLEGRTILSHGSDGVLAVHSLSKRSNFAGMRVGFYTGDAELVGFLAQARRHLGLMVPGPVQAAAVAALDDDAHVEAQRERYRRRLELLSGVFGGLGLEAPSSGGGFYLWVPAPEGDAWALARRIAAEAGALVSPGEFYGPAGAGYVRVAAVASDERLALLAERLALPGRSGGPR